MKRTAICALWLLSLTGAYLAGRLTGPQQQTATVLPAADVAEWSHPQPSSPPPLPDAYAGAADKARMLVREGRPHEALALLDAYLREHPRDAEALFLLSDLEQMTGAVDAALAPLLEILRVPPTAEVEARARRRLDLLINAREQQLINAGDLAALVSYFEALVLAEPAWDGHRLKLARWLARSGELDQAARLLREVGYVGVSQAEIDALAREIELARTALPVERHGGALYARATVTGRTEGGDFRFLVDTGATLSGLAESKLIALGAEKLRDRVRVRTAVGVAELPLYRLRELTLGTLVLRDLPVLGFEELPADADGLLGMDVLDRLSGDLPGAVGTPRIPR